MRILPLLLVLFAVPVSAGVTYTQAFRVDLDRDGKVDTVALKAFKQEGATLQQLVVLDGRGRVLWAGPRWSKTPASPSEPLVFGGEFDLGEIEAVGDFDGDGSVDVLGTYQKSDVSPTRFRLLRWKGGRFVHVRSGNLVQAPQRPGTWIWRNRREADLWLDRFLGVTRAGLLKVRIEDTRSGKPIEETVRMTTEGFQIAR